MYSRDGPVNLVGLLSGRAKIRSGYCPRWEMYVWLLSVGEMSVGNMPSGKCPSGYCSVGLLYGYHPKGDTAGIKCLICNRLVNKISSDLDMIQNYSNHQSNKVKKSTYVEDLANAVYFIGQSFSVGLLK